LLMLLLLLWIVGWLAVRCRRGIAALRSIFLVGIHATTATATVAACHLARTLALSLQVLLERGLERRHLNLRRIWD